MKYDFLFPIREDIGRSPRGECGLKYGLKGAEKKHYEVAPLAGSVD